MQLYRNSTASPENTQQLLNILFYSLKWLIFITEDTLLMCLWHLVGGVSCLRGFASLDEKSLMFVGRREILVEKPSLRLNHN